MEIFIFNLSINLSSYLNANMKDHTVDATHAM